jgi:hypothetical protein
MPTFMVVPDLEAGNMLAKQLSFLAGADAAGVVVGARVPIILTSRADSARTSDRVLRRGGADGTRQPGSSPGCVIADAVQPPRRTRAEASRPMRTP